MRDDDLRKLVLRLARCPLRKVRRGHPYQDGLDAGFPFRGRRVPFLSYEAGDPLVSNGLSLCSIHHRALDRIWSEAPRTTASGWLSNCSRMKTGLLELLKGAHGAAIHVPERKAWRPDRELLARRFDRFLAT